MWTISPTGKRQDFRVIESALRYECGGKDSFWLGLQHGRTCLAWTFGYTVSTLFVTAFQFICLCLTFLSCVVTEKGLRTHPPDAHIQPNDIYLNSNTSIVIQKQLWPDNPEVFSSTQKSSLNQIQLPKTFTFFLHNYSKNSQKYYETSSDVTSRLPRFTQVPISFVYIFRSIIIPRILCVPTSWSYSSNRVLLLK